ncbi:MAG: NAD+ synthase [Rickettsiaceae bacterium]|nr:NAD+ synthase [Rickettsiaceae bacterium]
MKFYLAQINPILAHFEHNMGIIKKEIQNSHDADIVIFPELAICGYNPQDLILREDFVSECMNQIDSLCSFSKNIDKLIIIGSPRLFDGKTYNSAFCILNGKIIHIHDKIALPNYGVFDENRLFAKGQKILPISISGKKICVIVCEDMWNMEVLDEVVPLEPDYVICINASPYTKSKIARRNSVASNFATRARSALLYVNQVGLQDTIIYDGSSFILGKEGRVLAEANSFSESHILWDSEQQYHEKTIKSRPRQQGEAEIYEALMLALKDYVRKNNFREVIIGFSSGIDSSLTSLIAFDAIGAENVNLYALPSKNNSLMTHKDASDFCSQNKVLMTQIEIDKLFNEFTLSIKNLEDDTTLQNLQSRIRGIILMALANQKKALLLSTGNKSELAVGYATLYGDMNGGFNLLKDLYKIEVYKLAKWRNENIPQNSAHKISRPIPLNILTKEPTAELRTDQKDSDTLPPYHILDEILYNYIDLLKSKKQIKDLGLDSEIVDYVINLVRIGQFKRYQSTMGPKISDMSFDLDWRYPITNYFEKKK